MVGHLCSYWFCASRADWLLWDRYEKEATALGFSGPYERYLQQVPMKLDHVCRVGKGARAPVVRVTCKLDCARRAHAVSCQWWARRAKRAFAHPAIHFERNAL